jgi:3-oxoadipate enol-lactonase
MQIASVNGIAVHHADEGPRNAPAIVFVNSLGTDFRIWDGVVAALDGRFRTIRYDKRGHGLSDAPPAPYRMADHVGDLEALLALLGVGKAVFVGLSVGGMIVTQLASRHPQKVAGLVLCDTAHKIGTDELWNERIAAVESRGVAAVKDVVMQRWFSPSFRQNEKAALAVYANMLSRQPVAGYSGTCAALRDTDNTELVKALKMPVLLIVGSNDGSTPPDLVRSTHDLIPGSTFVVLDGPGHIPCVEAPGETARLIRDFASAAH